MTSVSIAMVRVTAARAFRRAGIGFAAGVNELDLLELSAAQIIAIAREPSLVMEGRLFGGDEWQVFPVPTNVDLPLLEAELAVAKAKVGEMRMIAGAANAAGLDATNASLEPIGQLAASIVGPDAADQHAAADAAEKSGDDADKGDAMTAKPDAELPGSPTPPPAPTPAPEAAAAAEAQAPTHAAGKGKPAK